MIKKILQLTTLVLLSIVGSLGGIEILLQLLYHRPDQLCIFPPYLHYELEPDSNIIYGVKGIKNFDTDELGMRKINSSAAQCEILFLGGSTTECLYLDNMETWPYLLTTNLGLKGASIGKSGSAALDHYLQLKYFTAQLPALKTVVIMTGLNDMLHALADTSPPLAFTSAREDSLVKFSFTHTNQFASSNSLKLIQIAHSAYRKLIPDTAGQAIQDAHGECYRKWRTNRLAAKNLIDTPIDAYQEAKLQQYMGYVQSIVSIAKERHLKLIFISQLAAWSDSMTARQQERLWMGGLGKYQMEQRHEYYSPMLLKQRLLLFNQVTDSICKENKIQYIDLDYMRAKPSYFYDDCHFNEQGAVALARHLGYNIITAKRPY